MIKLIKTLINWYNNLAKWFQNKWGIDINESWGESVDDGFESIGEAIVIISLVVIIVILKWLFF